MDDDADNCDDRFSFEISDMRVTLIWHRRLFVGSVKMRV